MANGCIPVIIQDGIVQPFSSILPYEDFSVQIFRSQVPQLEKILRGITEEEIVFLQTSVAHYASYFIWDVMDRARFAKNTGGIHERSLYGGILKALHHKKSILHADVG